MEKENYKLLLIDDNPGDSFMIKFYLEESAYANFEITHEESLEEGIKRANQDEFHFVLLDLHFENSSGIATLEKFQDETNNLFVIVLTGLYDEELGIQALKLGAQDYIVKGQFDNKSFNNTLQFAYERYLFNFKFENNIKRFNYLQDISGHGYYEFLEEVNEVRMASILGFDFLHLDQRDYRVEDFSQLFEDSNGIIEFYKAPKEKKVQTFKMKNGMSIEIGVYPERRIHDRMAGTIKIIA